MPRFGTGCKGGVSSPALLPVPGPLGLIGFDAADIVGRALLQRGHQVIGLFLRQRERQKSGRLEDRPLALPVEETDSSKRGEAERASRSVRTSLSSHHEG